MSRLAGLICILTLLPLVGCVSTRVSSDYDSSVDFSHFNAFSWLPEEASNNNDPKDGVKNAIAQKRFKRLISEALESKGYEADPENPDLYISYHVSVRERRIRTSGHCGCFHHGYHGHHGHHHFHHPFYEGYDSYVYDETTITIDIIDAATKELIWRGWTYERGYGPSLSEEIIGKAIQKIFSTFPPDPSKS